MNILFKFFSLLLHKLVTLTGSKTVEELHKYFPSSLLSARKIQCQKQANFYKFVVCQKCFTTFNLEDCLGKDGIQKCTYVHFPRHPQKCIRVLCNESLLKTAKTPSGRITSYPLKLYCFKSIIESIQQLVQQPSMLDLLNKWKERSIPDGVMADIYDGNVWKHFLKVNGKDFLLGSYNL